VPIEQVRTLLFLGLAAVSLLIWRAWQLDHAPPPPPPASAATAQTRPGGAPPGVPDAATDGQRAAAPGIPAAPATPEAAAAPSETAPAPIEVRTDVLRVLIDPRGATLARLELLDYPVAQDQPEQPFALFDATGPARYAAQSGLIGADGLPTHHAMFRASATRYRLTEGADELRVDLTWRGEDGLEVVKSYRFQRGSYLIELSETIRNAGPRPLTARLYAQFQRRQVKVKRSFTGNRTYSYTGGVISTPEKLYEKIKFKDMAKAPLARDSRGGWVAMIQHYFAGAWIPPADAESRFYSKALGDGLFALGLISAPVEVPAGGTGTLSVKLYAGPKIQKLLSAAAPHLERTVDYGWLWFISEPLFWLLQKLHGLFGNWGWAIIVLTLMIKLVFFHLSATSYKSMARMRKMQPRITQLRERYAGDRQRMNQAMMELYKKEKINPLGGCLPIAVQIPVFIALYWVLLESVELRQAPFMLWIQDLSNHDPYFVLPILMGITMLLQQRLNPPPPDPIQAKVMMALPFVFTFFFLFFPAGLVLYWFVNNVLSIIQQWVITRKIVGPSSA